MKGGNEGSGSIEATLREFIHAVTAEVATQILMQTNVPRPVYATSKNNPLGSAESFLLAAAKGKFKAAKVGRTVRALWTDVEAYVSSLPAHKRKGVVQEDPDLDALLAQSATRKRPARGR